MSLWKLAKSIARDKSLNVKEVYDNLVQNRKKLRKMEDRVKTIGTEEVDIKCAPQYTKQ